MQMGSLCIHSSALSCIPAATLKQGLSLLPRLKISAQRCERGCRAPSLRRTLLGHLYCHTDVPMGPSCCHSPHRASKRARRAHNFCSSRGVRATSQKARGPQFQSASNARSLNKRHHQQGTLSLHPSSPLHSTFQRVEPSRPLQEARCYTLLCQLGRLSYPSVSTDPTAYQGV